MMPLAVLSAREGDVLALMAEGTLPTPALAAGCGVIEGTVENTCAAS
jgi:DNA-binding CsgD family transcriptional regulator